MKRNWTVITVSTVWVLVLLVNLGVCFQFINKIESELKAHTREFEKRKVWIGSIEERLDRFIENGK